jgi:hypothetical protein
MNHCGDQRRQIVIPIISETEPTQQNESLDKPQVQIIVHR